MLRKLILVSLLAALPLAASAQSFGAKPFLSVQGHAEAKVKPDTFPLAVTLKELSMDSAKAQALVEGLAEKVLDTAKTLDVAETDIDVGNLSISPEVDWDEKTDKEIFKGNTYERKINLRFRSLDVLKRFLEAMPLSRNLQLDTGTFVYSKAAELKRKLRREAIEDAKRGAADMAAAVDKRLLDLFNVSDKAQSTIYADSGYSFRYSDMYGYTGNTASLGAVTVQGANAIRGPAIVLREGEITVSADAFLVYLIGD